MHHGASHHILRYLQKRKV